MGVSIILFILLFLGSTAFFALNIRTIVGNIKMGKPLDRSGNRAERLKTMTLVALGQKKMFTRPIPAILHLFIYVAFMITQIELIEIIMDGVTGNHRMFWSSLGGFYTFIISIIEVVSMLALVATFAFLARRNLLKIPRFHMDEMTGWPKLDGNIILYMEIVLVMCIFTMNGADEALFNMGHSHAVGAVGEDSYGFAITGWLGGAVFGGFSEATLVVLERIGWWGHLIMVFTFLNYLPYSKHFHILLAFPNTYFSNLEKKGKFTNLASVKTEVENMFDPSFDPYAAPPEGEVAVVPERFGAKDVTDLSWKQLMDSYSCTECGRCTSSCPANQTGKKLSPRKIMMDTRDRLDEISKYKRKNGKDADDGKSLLYNFVLEEEIWACTSCNACVEECPINIDPLSIIMDIRRFLVMEESKVPSELAGMLTNIENNGAPWQFSQNDRLNWATEA
ncbi:MAG: heterodisulfide reductase subunit C [Flavobacteriales bacterium]|jgi:heterodisulfide reductase subunit C